MPTAAKLAAAALFAILGWIVANAHVPALGEGVDAGLFREGVALIGVIVGWRVMGPVAGKGYGAAIGSGMKTALVLAFFGLLVFSIYEMIQLSMKMRYDGPMDAVLDVFRLMLDQAQKMLTPTVIGSLFIGGAIAGLLTENASRRWK